MIFDLDKAKVIKVETDIEGIDSAILNFQFRIVVDNVSYGFPGELEDGTLVVTIPALATIMNDAKSGEHEAVLEASSLLEDGSGYYNLLWKGPVTLKAVPSVKVTVEPEAKSVNQAKTSITSITEEDVSPSMDHVDPTPEPSAAPIIDDGSKKTKTPESVQVPVADSQTKQTSTQKSLSRNKLMQLIRR